MERLTTMNSCSIRWTKNQKENHPRFEDWRMSPRLRVMWFALLFCLGLLLLVPVTFAAPTPFARIDLDHPQELRNMTVSNVEVIDLMDPSLSRVTLFSTNGDGSDTKIIPLPSLQTVRRIFSERVAFCKDYTLTVLGPLDSTVSVAGLGEYTVFIRPHLPVVRCQVPGATADIVMAKVNASSRQVDISGLVSSTDMAYLLQDPRGVLAMQQHPQVIGAYGSWTSADYNASDLSFTFVHNQFDISDYTLDRGIARSVSNLTAFISGTPPKPGEYLISAFQYSPVDQKATTYAAWPVVILDGNNRFVFVGKSTPYQYDLMSGEDLVLTFENPTRINNLTYILIKDGENYDAQVDVNMTALEESPDESGLDVILSGNLFLTLLKDTGTASPVLQNIISYSITRQGSPPTIQPPHNHEINITPGYGISGYALNSTYVVIGQDNLTTLKEGSFSVYAMGLDGKNDIVALDYGKLLIGVVPNINFSGQPTGGTAPLQVQFTDTTTGNPTSWSWSFGDGTANDTARNPAHQYQNAGTYDVTLTASNGGLSSVMTKPRYVSVTTPGLHADFSGQPTGGTAPLQVQFTDTTTGNPMSWNWSFGDGTVNDTTQNPSHQYQNAGTYDVTLTASNGSMSSSMTKLRYISVISPGLRADFVGDPTSGYYPLIIQFSDTSTGPHDTWNWDFGNGGSSAEQNPVHTYLAIKSYNVSLTVSNATSSDTLTRSSYITVISRGGSGGGGGGGYFFNPPINATPTPTPTRMPTPPGGLPLGLNNRTTQPVVIISTDGFTTLSLGTGVAVSGADGRVITVLTLEQVADDLLPQFPPGYTTVPGFAYAILPKDAVIDSGANLKIMLSGDNGASLVGKDLVIVRYDAGSGSWVPFNTQIDAVAKTVSADITKGGIYALVIRGPMTTVDTTTPGTTTIPVVHITPSPPASTTIPWTIITIALVGVVIVAGVVALYVIRVRKGKPPDT